MREQPLQIKTLEYLSQMANRVQTVSRSDIYRTGNGYYYINDALYTQTAYDVYSPVNPVNPILRGPAASTPYKDPKTGEYRPSIFSGNKYVDNFRTTDVVFMTVALGEGELYKILPDGPQDIEINDSSIDDLIDLDGTGDINTDNFFVDYRLGTADQSSMPIFGENATSPRGFSYSYSS